MKTIEDVISGDLNDVQARMDAVEAFLLESRLSGRNLTTREEDALNSYVLRDDLRYNHADKMTLIEYPVMSPSQADRRAKKEKPIGMASEYGTDGKNYRKPTRKSTTTWEKLFVDKNAKSRNKERRATYVAFTKPQPVTSYMMSPDEIAAYLAETYPRDRLVHG